MAWEDYIDSPYAVAEVALDGQFVRANRKICELLGYSEEELTARRVRDVTHPDDRPQSVAIVDRSLRHYEESLEVIKRYLHKDGTVIWALLRTTLKRNSQGEPAYFLSFVEDVRQRLQKEQLPRALAHRLQEFREQERHRVARELHDELGQVLTALKLELSWLQDQVPAAAEARAARLSMVVDGVMASVRRLSQGLHPPILDDLGLEAAIEALLEDTCGRHEILWKFQKPQPVLLLDSSMKLAIFRICQESITNILRHAQAHKVQVKLRRRGQKIILSVADDGVGVGEFPHRSDASGLLGIRDRVGLLGGSVEIRANRPRGTVIAVELPVLDEVGDDRMVPPSWA